MTASSWALALANAVAAQLGRMTVTARVRWIRPTADDVLEVVFSAPGDNELRGLRVDRQTLEAATGRLAQSSLDEIAFDVVTMGIDEPRPIEEFCVADTSGVRWLRLSDWLADIS